MSLSIVMSSAMVRLPAAARSALSPLLSCGFGSAPLPASSSAMLPDPFEFVRQFCPLYCQWPTYADHGQHSGHQPECPCLQTAGGGGKGGFTNFIVIKKNK